MNNMENKLTIGHLAPYLPYELKVVVPDEEFPCRMDAVNLQSIFIEGGCDYALEDIKLVLRPLSSLKNPIDRHTDKPQWYINFEGEMFAASDHFMEIVELVWDVIFEKDQERCVNKDELYQWIVEKPSEIPHCVFEKLVELHYDVFGLISKGLAVEMDT
jgi:hypothetical protein